VKGLGLGLSSFSLALRSTPAVSAWHDRKLRSSPLFPIFLIVVVDVLGLTIILPLLPFYAEKLGASPAVVGLLIAAYAACQLVAGPMLGRISDHVGRRPVLLVSQMGTLTGFLLLAFAQSLWLIFVARAIDGLTAGNLSLAQAYIADVTRPEERAKSFGIIGIAFGLGFLVGPGVSGYLSQFGYQWPIFAAAGLSATSIMGTYFLLPSSPPRPEGEQEGPPLPAGKRLTLLDWGTYVQYFRRPELAGLLWQFFAFALSFAMFFGGFALYAERRYWWDGHRFGAKEVGYFFAYAGFLGIILQGGLIGRLVKRFGERKLVWSGFFAATISYVALAFTWTTPQLVLTGLVSSYGNGVLRPGLTSLITQRTGRQEQGVVLGLNQSLNSVAQIVAPSVAGFLIDRDWLAAWALTAAVITGIGLSIRTTKNA